MNIYGLIYLCGLSQPLGALSHFERNFQDDILKNFQRFNCVRCAKIKNSDYFAEVIMNLVGSFSQ